VIDSPFLARGEPAVSLDDDGVLEELHLEIVLGDAGEVDDDLERRCRLVHVRGGLPPGLHEEAQSLAPPEVAERPRLLRAHCHRVAIAETSITHHQPVMRAEVCSRRGRRSI
jgi:hypothetical protein